VACAPPEDPEDRSVPTAQSGFSTPVNGLSFPNYTNRGVTNLTAAEVYRLFGDQVCASTANGVCHLAPAASTWTRHANAMMNGGHCFGISHFTQLLWAGTVRAEDFGVPNAASLSREDPRVQREIAYWMATQLTSPARDALYRGRPKPMEALHQLADGWAAGRNFTVALYQDGAGGHAVTPVAVHSTPDGKGELVIYDNNYPGQDRVITFDPDQDSWTFSASANPQSSAHVYTGDAHTKSLILVPVDDAVGVQHCPFCGDHDPDDAEAGFRTVSSMGAGDVLVEDDQGHAIGTQGRDLVHDFPGAVALVPLSNDLFLEDTEPHYRIPGGRDLTITMDGRNLTEPSDTEVAVTGRGYSLYVQAVALDPSQRDVIVVSADGETITYHGSGNESPVVHNTFSTAGHDYVLGVEVQTDGDGSNFTIDRSATQVKVHFREAGPTRFGIQLTILGDTVDSFSYSGSDLGGDATLYLDLSSWAGQGTPLTVEVDEGSDGTVDRVLELPDQG
jgi:hypothetical protein